MKDEIPSSRADWAKLSWQEAQLNVAKILQEYGFMRFEEKRFENSKRADIVVIKNSETEVIFGVVEVKSYRRISWSIEVKAMKQVCNYLAIIFDKHHTNQRWGNKTKRYFAATVFTNDYPGLFSSHSKIDYKKQLRNRLIEWEYVDLISTTPDHLIQNLISRDLAGYKQDNLDSFF